MKLHLPVPCLCLVTDRRLCHSDPGELEKVVAMAVEGGVNLVQLREKDLPGAQLLKLAEGLRKVTEGSALFTVNERVDVAVACGADGVQLGEDGLPVTVARRVAGNGYLIGRSVHSQEGAVAAEAQGADFLVVGTIFPTSSHPGTEPTGPRLLSDIAGTVGVPCIGIGGVTAANVGDVMGAGASGVAVITAVLASHDPGQAAWELKGAMDAAWERYRTYRRTSSAKAANPSQAITG